jgi:Bacteriophage abortive infection AbiH
MNQVYIIGNGFDLNLGLKTRYIEFFEYYKKTISKNSIISELKNNISSDIENWADFEIALGKYTINLNNLEEFDIILDDIKMNLSNYLINQENLYAYLDLH